MEFEYPVDHNSVLVIGGNQLKIEDEGSGFSGSVTVSKIQLVPPMTTYSGPDDWDPDALCRLINAVKDFVEFHAALWEPTGGYDGPFVATVRHTPSLTEVQSVEDCESS